LSDGSVPGGERPKKKKRRGSMMPAFGGRLKRTDFFHRVSASVVRGLMGLVKRIGRTRAERLALLSVRIIGPLLPENRMARDSIAKALPEKSAAEREAILKGAWANFARVIVEFVFLGDLAAAFDPAHPDTGTVTVSGIDRFVALRDDGKPAIIVAAHLANWEILGVVAHKFGLKSVLPFRVPSNLHFAEDLIAQREAMMGKLVSQHRGAAMEIAAALDRGDHLGMLVDQRLAQGIAVPFFGRPAMTNPLAAKFARQYDCPVHGARAVRRPDGGLHLELTGPLDLPRDAAGLIDVPGAMAVINNLVESWVREHPDQWFWLHNRWKR
jgi:KDO2-lipid IV(A) lauroyltransferase